jgi:hypothetical protein
MTDPVVELSQRERATGRGPTGTLVLSSSWRLLFIDRKAIEIMSVLDQDVPPGTGTDVLPPCLRTVADEIVAIHFAGAAAPSVPWTHASRLLGPISQPIRVQGFTAPCRGGQDHRIILVLSQCDAGVT